MLSFQVHQRLELFLQIINSQTYLNENLINLAKLYDSTIDVLSKSATDFGNVTTNGGATEQSNRFEKAISEILGVVLKIRASQIFSEISIISRAYLEFNENQNLGGDNFLTALKHFSDTYDDYLNGIDVTGKKSKLLQVLGAAKAFYFSLISVRVTLSTVLHSYKKIPDEVGESDKVLSLLIESEMDLSRFIEKLNALNIIYIELCTLTSIPINENPLKIVRIEAGSMWAEILGYPKIIEMLESMLEGSISYFYRTFTREGKIASIPRKVESVESILELRKKLKAIGVDTTDLDDHLQKASVIIAAETNRLLVGEPKITLNGRVFTIGKELERKYLEAGRRLYLPKFDDN